MREMNPRSQSSRSVASCAKAVKVGSCGRADAFCGKSRVGVDVLVVDVQVLSETAEVVGLVQAFCGGKSLAFAEVAVCGFLA